MHEDILEKITIPEGVEAKLEEALTIKGPKGEITRKFTIPIRIEGNEIILEKKNGTKNHKRMIKTTKAHINNMVHGVMEGYEYALQVCAVHFPMTVTADKEYVTVKNFLGETKERKARILPNVEVKVKGDIVEVKSPDKEAAGQTTANIENATRVRNRDRRVFQDGIWTTKKANKNLAEE